MPRDETMAKESVGQYRSQPLRCHACAARDRAAKEYTKQNHDDAGLMFSVEPIE